MTDNDIKLYIDDILDALSENTEKKISREELEKEFKRFLEYGVPLDHAKQTLIKKFGGKLDVPVSERSLIVDLLPDQNNIHLLCRIITINPKDITVKGESRKIFYGILGDESGTVSFTAWKDFEIEKGDVLEISNAYTKEWQGDTKINLGDRAKIEKTDESRLPESSLEPREYKLRDLRSGLGAVEVTARILDVNKREVEVDGEKKTVYSGVIGDETGKAQYTSWHDFSLKEGDVLKISGGYIKSWKGIPQLTFDEKAVVEKMSTSMISKKDVATQKLPLYMLVERRGALDVEVEGTVIEIRKGSGLVYRCPECNRVLQEEKCMVHGDVKGKLDLRMKLVIDDGTGTVGGIIGKDVTERLLGKKLVDLKKIVEKADGGNRIVEDMNEVLFARRIFLRGNALGDEFGTTVIAKDAGFVDFNVEAESDRLFQELEDL